MAEERGSKGCPEWERDGLGGEQLSRRGGREGGCRAINTSQVTGCINEGRELVTFHGASEKGQGAMT